MNKSKLYILEGLAFRNWVAFGLLKHQLIQKNKYEKLALNNFNSIFTKHSNLCSSPQN